jgi:hypothetical protein
VQLAVWRNGGITPQTILWKIERYYPAASSVEAATAPSRWDVSGNAGDSAVERESWILKLNSLKQKSKQNQILK